MTLADDEKCDSSLAGLVGGELVLVDCAEQSEPSDDEGRRKVHHILLLPVVADSTEDVFKYAIEARGYVR